MSIFEFFFFYLVQSILIIRYGRIMASKFANGAGGDTPAGTPCMPYCPQPAGSNKINPVRPAVTKYHVTDVIYYYD